MAKTAGGSSLPDDGSPLEWVRKGVFPEDWTLIPVAGKATYVPEWGSKKRSRIDAEALYQADSRSSGFGVVTGELSGGLLAVDIDGPRADERFRKAVGDGYEPFGEETTMSWTSGKEGRRQILYRVPQHMVRNLTHVTTVILQEAGQWELGKGDVDRNKGEEQYQEVVLRFNRCQSVLPRSIHPDTKGRYRFLNYNGGKPAEAPEWLLEILRSFQKAQAWLSESQMAEVRKHVDLGDTLLPERQIRGWFFGEDVQRALMPRLEDLVFKHRTFEEYGWRSRDGKNAQRMSGCPWHGGESGTAFQYGVDHGCWDCKACGVGGDVLDFIHKVESGDKHADRPRGKDLETYVARIAGELGFRYPEDANVQVTKESPRVEMDEVAFHEALIQIHDSETNPAVRLGKMAGLAQATGRRLTGPQCLAAMDEYRYYEDAKRKNRKTKWWQDVERMTYTIPNVLKVPSQTVLHAAAGEGKTSACMGLAKAIGRGLTMRVRGIEVPVRKGNVLWVQNDQSIAKLIEDCEDNGIDPETDDWFIVKRGFQLNHTNELMGWIREYKPVLVVVDSISSCSTKLQVDEKEKAFASPFYFFSERNGDPGEEGFPACSIIWIHHDNANGDVRGTKLLVAAMDEQWHLRKLKDDERDDMRSKGLNPSSCRFIQIKKSRMDRGGDRLIVHRDENFAYSVWDFTPTEKREDEGNGDPDPSTSCLRMVKEHVLGARKQRGDDRLTAQEVWERLGEEMTGQGRKTPSSKTVKRWLDRWIAKGLLEAGKKKKVEGVKQLVPTYTLPGPRVYPPRKGVLFSDSPDPLQSQEKTTDTNLPTEDVVRCSEADEGDQQNNGQIPESSKVVRCSNSVVDCDLGEERPKDAHTQTTREAHEQPDLSDQADLQAASPLEGIPGLEGGGPRSDSPVSRADASGDGGLPEVEPHSADVLAQGEERSVDREPAHDPRWDDFDTAFG